jgi:hypothetical protein
MMLVAIKCQRHPDVAVEQTKIHGLYPIALRPLLSRRVPGFFDFTIGNWTRRTGRAECEERSTMRRPSATKSLTFRPRISPAAFEHDDVSAEALAQAEKEDEHLVASLWRIPLLGFGARRPFGFGVWRYTVPRFTQRELKSPSYLCALCASVVKNPFLRVLDESCRLASRIRLA